MCLLKQKMTILNSRLFFLFGQNSHFTLNIHSSLQKTTREKRGGTHFLFPLNKKNKKRVLKEKTLLILKKYEVFLKNGLFSSKLYGIHATV